jgi:hypothetical protein
VLFLYRPRETWMPYSLPRNRTDQAAYNRQLQEQFRSTRRVAPPVPVGGPPADELLHELDALRAAGALTDEEHRAAVARVRGR